MPLNAPVTASRDSTLTCVPSGQPSAGIASGEICGPWTSSTWPRGSALTVLIGLPPRWAWPGVSRAAGAGATRPRLGPGTGLQTGWEVRLPGHVGVDDAFPAGVVPPCRLQRAALRARQRELP